MLSDRKRKVIDSYLRTFNKKQAMLDAGYSESMSDSGRHEVFGDPEVKAEIARRQALTTHRTEVTLDWLIGKLKAIVEADLIELYNEEGKPDLKKLNPALKTAITSISSKGEIGLADKLKAIELLIRHLGLSKEKISLVATEQELVAALHEGRKQARIESAEADKDKDVV